MALSWTSVAESTEPPADRPTQAVSIRPGFSRSAVKRAAPSPSSTRLTDDDGAAAVVPASDSWSEPIASPAGTRTTEATTRVHANRRARGRAVAGARRTVPSLSRFTRRPTTASESSADRYGFLSGVDRGPARPGL